VNFCSTSQVSRCLGWASRFSNCRSHHSLLSENWAQWEGFATTLVQSLAERRNYILKL